MSRGFSVTAEFLVNVCGIVVIACHNFLYCMSCVFNKYINAMRSSVGVTRYLSRHRRDQLDRCTIVTACHDGPSLTRNASEHDRRPAAESAAAAVHKLAGDDRRTSQSRLATVNGCTAY